MLGMSVVAAFADACRRVLRAPVILLGLWLVAILVPSPVCARLLWLLNQTGRRVVELPLDARGCPDLCALAHLLRHERIGLAISLMLRSIPFIAGSVGELRDAMRARGLRPDPVRLVTPAVISTVAYAHRTGEALAARGFD